MKLIMLPFSQKIIILNKKKLPDLIGFNFLCHIMFKHLVLGHLGRVFVSVFLSKNNGPFPHIALLELGGRAEKRGVLA